MLLNGSEGTPARATISPVRLNSLTSILLQVLSLPISPFLAIFGVARSAAVGNARVRAVFLVPSIRVACFVRQSSNKCNMDYFRIFRYVHFILIGFLNPP